MSRRRSEPLRSLRLQGERATRRSSAREQNSRARWLPTICTCARYLIFTHFDRSTTRSPLIALCIESVNVKTDWNFTWWVMASASGQRGELDRAREALAQLSRLRQD